MGTSSSSKSSAAPPSKRKRGDEIDVDIEEEEEEDEDDLVFQNTGEEDDSPQITIKHTEQLKKLDTQCFCGKGGFQVCFGCRKTQIECPHWPWERSKQENQKTK